MVSTYFTFGQNHTHRFEGKTFDCDCVVEIKGESHNQNRATMFEVFGAKFAFQYNEKPDLKFFPRGILEVKA